jgi:hypothetical protein
MFGVDGDSALQLGKLASLRGAEGNLALETGFCAQCC